MTKQQKHEGFVSSTTYLALQSAHSLFSGNFISPSSIWNYMEIKQEEKMPFSKSRSVISEVMQSLSSRTLVPRQYHIELYYNSKQETTKNLPTRNWTIIEAKKIGENSEKPYKQ